MKVLVLAISIIVMLAMDADAQSGYWQITGVYGSVWSLSDNDIVPTNNPSFLAWEAAGNRATPIKSSADLYDVIQGSFPSHLAASAPGLDALGLTPFQAFLWRRSAGLNIIYNGNAGLDGRYAIDDQWMSGLMVGALLRCGSAAALPTCEAPFPQGQATYNYIDLNGSVHNMTASQMVNIVIGIEDYVASLYTQLAIGMGGGSPTWPSATATVGP